MSHKDKLKETLADLHQQLAAVETGDPEVRAMLIRSLREISDRLEAQEQGAAIAGDGSPIEQMRAAARQFEVDHPGLAATIESAVDMLSRMGI